MKNILFLFPVLFLSGNPTPLPVEQISETPIFIEEDTFAKKSVPPQIPLDENPFLKFRDWMVREMAKVNPPGHYNPHKPSRETKEEALDRMRGIATDIITIAFRENEPPLFDGEKAYLNTALMLFANTRYESYWRKDVELGISWRDSKGTLQGGRGDQGKSWCLTQMYLSHPNKDGKTRKRIILDEDYLHWTWDSTYKEGYGGEDLIADRALCLTAGLHYIRFSFNQCKKFKQKYWLSSYMGPGNCSPLKASVIRMNYFWKLIWRLKQEKLDTINDDSIAMGMAALGILPEMPYECENEMEEVCMANH